MYTFFSIGARHALGAAQHLPRLLLAATAASFSLSSWAAKLQNLDVSSLPGDRVELRLDFDGPVAEPRSYSIERPARIALDLNGVSNGLKFKNRELSAGNARQLTVLEAGGRTRLIINLSTLAPYSTRVNGNQMYVLIGDKHSQPVASTITPQRPAAVTERDRFVRNIDFRRGANGEGNLVIRLSKTDITPAIRQQGGKIRVELPNTRLPQAQQARVDVKDFATAVDYYSAIQAGTNTLLTLEPKGNYDYLSFQTNDQLTISVKPLQTAAV